MTLGNISDEYCSLLFSLQTLSHSEIKQVGKRRILAVVGLALLAFFFSLILSIFRSKVKNTPDLSDEDTYLNSKYIDLTSTLLQAGGYPYSFLIK